MKTIEIKGKTYPLHFGIGFIREMDKRHEVNLNGIPYGMGISVATVQLIDQNPVVIEDIILSATSTLNSQPSKVNIEEWLESQEDFVGVFNDFLEVLKNAPMTRAKVNKILSESTEE